MIRAEELGSKNTLQCNYVTTIVTKIEADIIYSHSIGDRYVYIDYVSHRYWREVVDILEKAGYEVNQSSGLGIVGSSEDMVVRWG